MYVRDGNGSQTVTSLDWDGRSLLKFLWVDNVRMGTMCICFPISGSVNNLLEIVSGYPTLESDVWESLL